MKNFGSGKSDEERLGKLTKTVNKIAKRYGMDKDEMMDEMENISKSKEAFIEDLFKNLDAFPNNILYEEFINTDNGIVDDIYMALSDDNEVTREDLLKIFEKKKVILDINVNEAIKEDVDQVVRIINRTYRINEKNFEWKNRITIKNISKKLKVVTKPVSELVPEKTVEQENKMTDLEKEIKQALKEKGIECKSLSAKKSPEGKFFVDILFENKIEENKTIESVLKEKCGTDMVFLKDSGNISDNMFMQKYISEDKFIIQVGVAKVLSPQKEFGAGAIGTKLQDNKYLIAVSDSKEGLKASRNVLEIVKENSANGFNDTDTKQVIESAFENSLEPLRASLDMLCFDLFSGKVSYIKQGCMPTYIKKDNLIDKLFSNVSMRPDLDIRNIETKTIDIKNGWTFVAISRGVAESHRNESSDEWFKNIINTASGGNSKKLAENILEKVISNSIDDINRDMYVIVAKIENAKQ